MNQIREQRLALDHRAQKAITELKQTISDRYPAARFQISRATDDPSIIHLVTTIDLDDPDEVGDLVIDRVAELIAEERIPIHVIHLSIPERIKAALGKQGGRATPCPSITLIHDVPL